MSATTIVKKEHSDLLVIELHRPEVRNAFHPEMIEALTRAFLEAAKNPRSQAVLLRGAGASFCAGADLSWMRSMAGYSQSENLEDSRRLHAMFAAVWDCPIPVISYAHGSVFGGGLGLLACSDLVIADPDTQFSFSEVRLGLSPAVIGDFIARKGLLPSLSAPMIFGNIFSAQEAVSYGLVQKLETWNAPEERALAWIAQNGPEAMRATKHLVRQLKDLDATAAKRSTTELISKLRVSSEAQSRLKAFFEKSSRKGSKP